MVKCDRPYYAPQIDTILDYARSKPNSEGHRCLSYRGMTVAGAPIQREIDDAAAPAATLQQYVVKEYEKTGGAVQVWEIRPLRFDTPSALESRADFRLSFYESLAIDPLGLIDLTLPTQAASSSYDRM